MSLAMPPTPKRRPACLLAIAWLLLFGQCAVPHPSPRPDEAASTAPTPVDRFPIEQFAESGPVTVVDYAGTLNITVRPTAEKDCDQAHVECYRLCKSVNPPWPMRPETAAHSRYCTAQCLALYMECIGEQATSYAFDSMFEATRWLYKHPETTASALVVIGTAAFVVITDGAGLLLVPLSQRAIQQFAR